MRPIVEDAIALETYALNTYDLSQKPYFHDPDDETMKSVQKQLIATKQQRNIKSVYLTSCTKTQFIFYETFAPQTFHKK
ncbi:MAG: hypothetical protein ACTS2F_29815 [Thainema sp.]